MNTQEFLLRNVDRNARVLELHPRNRPVAPKAQDWNVVVVDSDTTEALRTQISRWGGDPSLVEVVDYVWNDGALDDLIPPVLHGSFDVCIIQEMLEVVPNPLGLLRSISKLLKANGVIELVVADKFHNFNFFKPLSTTGDILDAFDRSSNRHSLKTAYHTFFDNVRQKGNIAWNGEFTKEYSFVHDMADAREQLKGYSNTRRFDAAELHAFYFTATAFHLIMLDLRFLGLIDYDVVELKSSDSYQFFVTLRKVPMAASTLSVEDFALRRMALVDLIAQELHQRTAYTAV